MDDHQNDVTELLTGQEIKANPDAPAEKVPPRRLNAESGAFGLNGSTFLDPKAAAAAASKQITSAESYLKVAGEFLTVVEMLVERAVPLRPWAYFTAQTLECTLKAYIGRIDPSKLGHPLRTHELIELWEMALNASSTAAKKLSIAPNPPEWCETLAVLHAAPYLDRYPGNDGMGVKMPGNEQLAGDLRAILREVEAAFQ